MSLVVGMNVGEYVLLASDTRITGIRKEGPRIHSDGHSKVHRTGMGIVTGTGFVGLLDSVRKRWVEEDPTHTDAIKTIVREESSEALELYQNHQVVSHAIKHETFWLFTYIGQGPDPLGGPDIPRIRLAVSHPDSEYQLSFVQPGSVLLGCPSGTTLGQADHWQEKAEQGVKTLEETPDFVENLAQNLGVMWAIIKLCAAENDTVSTDLQFAIHTKSHLRYISSIITSPDDLTVRLPDEVGGVIDDSVARD